MISVIVPTFNGGERLIECLHAVARQTVPVEDIILVDNASTDGAAQQAAKVVPRVRLVSSSTNAGVTGGRNLGLKEVPDSTRFVLFLDHDIILEPDAVGHLLAALERDPKAGIATSTIYYYADRTRLWAAGTSIDLRTGRIFFRPSLAHLASGEPTEVPVAPSVIFTRRALLEEIGGFDPIFFATYEDTDFCFRARTRGWKTVWAPRSCAYHDITPDPRDARNRLLSRSYFVARNRILFMARHASLLGSSPFLLGYAGYYTALGLISRKPSAVRDYARGVRDGLRALRDPAFQSPRVPFLAPTKT